jgi:hypothetical protein
VLGAKIGLPKQQRIGHAYTFRLDLAEPDSGGVSKYIVSVSCEDSWIAWRNSLGRAHASLAEQLECLTAYYAKHDPEKTAKQISAILDTRRLKRPSLSPLQWEGLSEALQKKYGKPLHQDMSIEEMDAGDAKNSRPVDEEGVEEGEPPEPAPEQEGE